MKRIISLVMVLVMLCVMSTGAMAETFEGVGANLIGVEWIQMITGSVVGGFTASIANNLYVNANGERFVAEDSRRDVLSGAVLEQPGSFFWLLSDAKTVWDLMGGADYNGNTVEAKKAQGLIEAETIEDLAAQLGWRLCAISAITSARMWRWTTWPGTSICRQAG